MTVQEASKTCFGKPYVVDVEEHEEAIKTIKEALEEVEQYRAIAEVIEDFDNAERETLALALEELKKYRALGTVEELKEALEKQIPKKAIHKEFELGNYYECPICGDITLRDYCGNCGQALKWGRRR